MSSVPETTWTLQIENWDGRWHDIASVKNVTHEDAIKGMADWLARGPGTYRLVSITIHPEVSFHVASTPT